MIAVHNDYDMIQKSLKKSIEMSNKPLLKYQEQMQKMINATQVNIPNISLPNFGIENYSFLQENPAVNIINERENELKELTSTLISNYTFSNQFLDKINGLISAMLQAVNESAKRLLSDSVRNIIDNMSSLLLDAVSSPALEWIRSIDFSPMITVLKNLNFDSDVLKRYRELNQVYLVTMYECKWFPYAGWTTDISLMTEVLDIIDTSRGKSKRREQRVDKVILKYYTQQEIKNIKRSLQNSDLESHIKKILGQAVEAHLRGEYALTIACLATMWEGLIHHKLHINGRYNQKKTKENFAVLIRENDFEPIFSEFYEKLIVSQCDTPEQVIDGVPNRNGISHSKYKKYPNKKASLNAILLTDFIIALTPKDLSEETENG